MLWHTPKNGGELGNLKIELEKLFDPIDVLVI